MPCAAEPFAKCICPGCKVAVHVTWASGMCRACASEDCDHPEPLRDRLSAFFRYYVRDRLKIAPIRFWLRETLLEKRVFSTRVNLGRLSLVWLTAEGRSNDVEPYIHGRVLARFGRRGPWLATRPRRRRLREVTNEWEP